LAQFFFAQTHWFDNFGTQTTIVLIIFRLAANAACFFCFALHTHGLFGFATTFTLLYFTASSQKKQQQQQQHTPPTPTQTTTTTATIIAATERFVRSSSCCEYIF